MLQAQIRLESPEVVELKSRCKICHFVFSQYLQDDVCYTACPRCQKPRTIYSNAPKTLLSARQRQPATRPPIEEQESQDSCDHHVIDRSRSQLRAPDIENQQSRRRSRSPSLETRVPRLPGSRIERVGQGERQRRLERGKARDGSSVQATNVSRPAQSTMASLEENYMGRWQPFEERNEPRFHEEMQCMRELDRLSNSTVIQGREKSSTRNSGRRQDQRRAGQSRGTTEIR